MSVNAAMNFAFQELRLTYANARKQGESHEWAKSFAMAVNIKGHHKLTDTQDTKVRKHFEEWAVE